MLATFRMPDVDVSIVNNHNSACVLAVVCNRFVMTVVSLVFDVT